VSSPRPATPEAIAALVAARADAVDVGHPVRLLVDEPPWAGLRLAHLVADALAELPRHVVLVDAADFLRPASLRLERGRDDPDAFYEAWIDLAALRREVLEPAGPDGSRQLLPSLWDAAADRATRADYVSVPEHGVVVVAGWFLLGAGLPAELTVHIALSAAARARRIPADAAERELPAWDRYDDEVRPATWADIVVRADDPRHPAVLET
jgi:hypothetical protein